LEPPWEAALKCQEMWVAEDVVSESRSWRCSDNPREPIAFALPASRKQGRWTSAPNEGVFDFFEGYKPLNVTCRNSPSVVMSRYATSAQYLGTAQLSILFFLSGFFARELSQGWLLRAFAIFRM
jgi:hypothetical protein